MQSSTADTPRACATFSDEQPEHELYFMCDDIKAAVARLTERGIETSPIADRGWGLLTEITLAPDERIGPYEPRHPLPSR